MADIFNNKVPPEIFRKTNAIWNKLRLNDPWSVGYVTYLIDNETFNAKEDWEAFYFQSGAERNQLIQALPEKHQKLLRNSLLKNIRPGIIAGLPDTLKRLNYYFGRTQDSLHNKGQILKAALAKKGVHISASLCYHCVHFRVICETWNGVIIRERNTINFLQQLFPVLSFQSVEALWDHQYAIDFILKIDDIPLCAIQIKPKSYLSEYSYIKIAKAANLKKHEAFEKRFGLPVFYVISNYKGEIYNEDFLNKIKRRLPPHGNRN